MQFSNVFVILFIIGSIGSFLLNQLLEYYDYSFRRSHGREIPSELAEYIDSAVIDKTCRYEDAKYKLWLPQNILGCALSLTLVFTGFYSWLFNQFWCMTQNVYLTALLFLLCGTLPSSVLSLPFELYGEFVVEKKFGFSTMTFRLWLADQIKGILLSLVLLVPLILIMIALLENASSWWWLLLGAVYVVFSLGISVLYPRFIAPLFNKFTPLEESSLKHRLSLLLEKTGFKASGVYVMDASKRSKHSNAYFTGFGKTKRIVLYDTLVKQLTEEEIEAVLGHELGHYKKHHIVKRLAVSIPLSFAVLFIVSLFIMHTQLYTGFGFSTNADVFPHMQFIGIFLLSLIFGGYSDVKNLVSNYFNRRDEFQADAFSAHVCGSGKPLITSLIKLNKENLSELTPPRIYCIFNYNHPSLLQRIRALDKKDSGKSLT
jgi:STE24 endopeptidase